MSFFAGTETVERKVAVYNVLQIVSNKMNEIF